MRGRKPKPSYLRVLDGNASHSAGPRLEEPIPTGDIAEPPRDFSPEQQRVWRYAIENAPPGMLKLIDTSVFAVWVIAQATLDECRQKVTEFGILVEGPKGDPVANPYQKELNRQAAIIMKAAAELGFSPTARPRVKVQKSQPASNPFAGLKQLVISDPTA